MSEKREQFPLYSNGLPDFHVSVMTRRLYGYLVLFFLLLFVSAELSSQQISLDNHAGTWTDNGAWVSASSPATAGINTDIEIYGMITHVGDLDFNKGDLTVHDTLVVVGNVVLGNKADLQLLDGAILIIRGDYTSGNKVRVSNGGSMVVTGEWEMKGSDKQGEFDNGGNLYVLDPRPGFKDGKRYTDLNCQDSPGECRVYGYDELIDSDIGDFFLGGGFAIQYSGSLHLCDGSRVTLFTVDDALDYQWFRDGEEIPGATSHQYETSSAGVYDVSFSLDGEFYRLPSVTVTVGQIPEVSITGPSLVCTPEESNYALSGSINGAYTWIPEGGVVSGTDTDSEVEIMWEGTGPARVVIDIETQEGCHFQRSIQVLKYTTPDTGEVQSGQQLARR